MPLFVHQHARQLAQGLQVATPIARGLRTTEQAARGQQVDAAFTAADERLLVCGHVGGVLVLEVDGRE